MLRVRTKSPLLSKRLGAIIWNAGGKIGLKTHLRLGERTTHVQWRILWFLWTTGCSLRCSVQFSRSVSPTLCDHTNCSTPGLPVHHQLPEFTQTHVHQVGDAKQPSHPLSSPSPAPNPSQHQGSSQWVNSSHEVAKVWESQLQHQSFQWTLRTDLL